MDDHDIVILGAGYAGLMCAARLSGQTKGGQISIALVNRSPDFVERLRLHEGLADPDFSPAARVRPLAEFIRRCVADFIEGSVVEIDRVGCIVHVDSPSGNRSLKYSRLVIALGSQVNNRRVPGVAKHAYVLDPGGPRGQPELRRRLAALAGKAPRFVVVGGGATGMEVAAELARVATGSVCIVEAGPFAAFATPKVRRFLRGAVERANIEVIENARIQRVESSRLISSVGALACELCVWCGGFRGSDVVMAAGLDVDGHGRVRVDPFLRSLSDPSIFVIGDACQPVEWHGAPARMSAFFALTTGAHVADTIARLYAGRRGARPFGFWTYGQAIAVGGEAVGFATIPYDRQIGPIYRRGTAFFLRWFFVWVLARLITLSPRFPRMPFWLGRGAYRGRAVARYAAPLPIGVSRWHTKEAPKAIGS